MTTGDLREIAFTREDNLSRYSGRTAAIDALNWIIKYTQGVQFSTPESATTTSNENDSAHIIGILRGIRRLLRLDITPLLAFDGKGMSELKNRHHDREKETFHHETQFFIETTQTLLELLEVPYIEGQKDGEAEAAAAVQAGLADFVISNDMDTLLFGTPVTIRHFTQSGPEQQLNLAGTLDINEITRAELVDIGLALGTDYFDGLPGLGPANVVDAVRQADSFVEMARQYGINPAEERIKLLQEYYLTPETATLTADSVSFPDPEIDQLTNFLKALEFPEQMCHNEISSLEQALSSHTQQ